MKHKILLLALICLLSFSLGFSSFSANIVTGTGGNFTETDTLQSVTDRGSVTSNDITINDGGSLNLLQNSFNTPVINSQGSVRISFGSARGALDIGADVNNVVRTANVRKIGSIVTPNRANNDKVEIFSFDTPSSISQIVNFGGRQGGSARGATQINFITAPDVNTNGGNIWISINNNGVTTFSGNLVSQEDAQFNKNVTVDGTVFASDFVTLSRVADFNSQKRSLDKLNNVAEWTKDDQTINYDEHYAVGDFIVRKKTGYEIEYIEVGECDDIECPIRYEERKIPIYEDLEIKGLSMETRVAEMEKMIWELKQDNEQLQSQINQILGVKG